MCRYLLMNQTDPVLKFSITERGFFVAEEIINKTRLPYYLWVKNELSGKDIKAWLDKRCVPFSRENYSLLEKEFNANNSAELSLKNSSLSLTDPYWVKAENSKVTWDDINFFTGTYSQDVGRLLLTGVNTCKSIISQFSPDITTNGLQPKLWMKKGGISYLYKFGRAPFYQEPINEIACSKIAMSFPNLEAVTYFEGDFEGKFASVCENFIAPGIEFVPASVVYKREEDPLGNAYFYLIKKAKEFGITDINAFLNEMITFDYLIDNSDRNLGNFGFLRDTDTGEILGMAPIFDNGNSMWFDEPPEMIKAGADICKPFANSHEIQMKLVKDIDISFKEVWFHIIKGLNEISKYTDEKRVYEMEQRTKVKMAALEKSFQKSRHRIAIREKGLER